MKKKEQQKGGIVVVNKLTYLFLVAAAGCVLYLIRDAVLIFYFKQMEVMQFFEDLLPCAFIAAICIYFFVKMNMYSAFWNPNHPKSRDELEDYRRR